MKTSSEKHYRVYRQRRRARGAGDGSIQWGDIDQSGTGGGRRRGGVPRRALRLLRRAAFVGLVLAVAWLLVAFLSFRSAVKERNDLLPEPVRAALAPVDGPALADDQITLLVGADTSAHRRRVGESNAKGGALSDTLILMRVDVPSRTVSMLSIPRDLYVEVPGFGREKINTAYANGGLPLAIRTVRSVTGVDINHVAQVDFDGLRQVVDSLGGITIDNPHFVASGPDGFDGRRPVFPKGELKLDGRNALAYARLRKVSDASLRANQEEATELGRGRRQQRVIDAIVGEVASVDSIRKPRDVPRAVVAPLITDISASQMLTFGFGRWWSKPSNNLRCRLGGDPETNAAGDVLVPVPENRATIRMWLGRQAPVKPQTGNAYAPGCVREGA